MLNLFHAHFLGRIISLLILAAGTGNANGVQNPDFILQYTHHA
jgi:hypothetical protein